MNLLSTTTERVKSGFLSKWCVFFANFREERDRNEVRRVFIFTLIAAGFATGIRELIRLRLDGEWEPIQPNEPEKLVLVEVDPVVVAITLILTMTFYPLLYLSYSYIYKGTEDKDTTVVLYNVTLVAQFAILRDILFVLFALLEYGGGLFKDTVSETGNYETPFMVLDVVLWILTIILLVPIIVDRLNRPKDREDTQMLAFSLSFFAFFLTWIFNYQILRIFIQLPLGRDV